jgi:IS30 family transposase
MQHGKRLTTGQRREIAGLRDAGWTWGEIAREYGIKKTSGAKVLRLVR